MPATIDTKDASGATVTVNTNDAVITKLGLIQALLPTALGQAARAAGLGVTLSTEDITLITSIVTALQIMDDWDESDRAKVNLIVGQAGVTGGAGAIAANTPRYTLASDDPAVAALGATSDAAATQGSTGSISAKLRTVTSQLNTLVGHLDLVETKLDSLIANGGLAFPQPTAFDSFTTVAISEAAGADNELVAAPGASKQIWVYSFAGIADTADGTVSLQDSDNTAVTGVMAVAEYGGIAFASSHPALPLWKVATNRALEIDLVGCGFKGSLSYAIVSV